MPPKPTSDDTALDQHTAKVPVGRTRPATLDEDLVPDTMFRPDAVLALAGPLPANLSPFEQHIALLVDGVRPVARIRKKSGVSSADLRIALAGLRDKKLLRLAGIVEEAIGSLAAEIKHDFEEDVTIPGKGEVIPTHVMAEIRSMLDEEDLANTSPIPLAPKPGEDDD